MKNQKMRVMAFSVVAGLGLAFGHQASGAVVYSYIAQQQHYSGNPGDVINVNVYLQEQVSAPDSGSFLATDGGLQAFGLAVNQSTTGVPSSPSRLTGAGANTADFTVFNGPTSDFVDAAGDAAQLAGSINSVLSPVPPGIEVNNGGPNAAISNAVYLGSLSVTVGQAGTTTFTLGAIDPVFGGSTVTRNLGYDLDTQVDSNFTPTTAYTGVGSNLTQFTVSTPEPASLGVLAMGGLLALRRRRA